ncbi:hypothetical protein NFI96_012169 [Prochilodus magdalenae]|nr:hypothetical protein NFI96_012169 [Prochilodus magdalenae]
MNEHIVHDDNSSVLHPLQREVKAVFLKMWRLKAVHHKASRSAKDLEAFKNKRREHEKALRQARRDRQLISKRLLINEDEQEEKEFMETGSAPVSPDQIREMLHSVQHGGEQKAAHLAVLRKALRDPQTHPMFTKLEKSMYVLVGQLSGHNTQCQLEAARCLHELSHSPHPSVGQSCLPATPYLLTYLFSPCAKLTELCLYTLGNLWTEGTVVKEKLLAQGIVPALANCIQNQKSNLAVVEAAGFTLSQLLQDKDTADRVIPLVISSGLVPHLSSILTPDPEFGLGPAIECAWCLHYIVSRAVDASVLLTQGVLSQCCNLLIILGGAVAKGSTEEGLELLIWPLLRFLGNLLASGVCEGAGCPVGLEDARLLAALCVFSQSYLSSHSALTRESLWVLNNLTAGSTVFCTALLFFKLVPALLQLLHFSKGINTMVLRILGNVAHNGAEYCVHLSQAGLLPALCATLKMADPDVVTLSLEVLYLLTANSPQVANEFVKLNGIPLLEAIQYNNEEEQRVRASYLLDHYLHTHFMLHPDSDPSNPSLHSQFVKLNEAYRVLSKEGSRREYDIQLRHYYSGEHIFRPSSRYTSNPSAETAERMRYWEQFRHAQDYSQEHRQKKRKKNLRLVGYCIVAMLLSIGTHYFGFRKLEEVHNNFMDEKDRVITEIYKESKERARVNGFKKQQEILRQKHAEFVERYKLRNGGQEK